MLSGNSGFSYITSVSVLALFVEVWLSFLKSPNDLYAIFPCVPTSSTLHTLSSFSSMPVDSLEHKYSDAKICREHIHNFCGSIYMNDTLQYPTLIDGKVP